jgi:branched-chain amino acid transport system ATP-binding protein
MTKILEVNDLHYHYNEIHALKGISFDVNEGEIISLIGANGAGKTTTMRSISGLIRGITGGTITFDGKNITKMKGYDLPKLGLLQVLEGRQIFSALTVEENLRMGAYLQRDPMVIKKNLEEVYGLFPKLFDRKEQSGGTLSGGEQQMLAIGRALMGNPKLLLLDEPSLGLAPLIVKDIFKVIKQINERGVTVLLVEQNSKAALQIADRGYVLENGEIVLADTADALLDNKEIQRSYLGI